MKVTFSRYQNGSAHPSIQIWRRLFSKYSVLQGHGVQRNWNVRVNLVLVLRKYREPSRYLEYRLPKNSRVRRLGEVHTQSNDPNPDRLCPAVRVFGTILGLGRTCGTKAYGLENPYDTTRKTSETTQHTQEINKVGATAVRYQSGGNVEKTK